MVKVYKIALTGGPCSGKSTSMKTLVDKFSADFKVYTLPECATTIVNAGVTIIPTEFTEETHTTFTRGICQLQMDLEKFFEEEAKRNKKDVIILTDRGVIDNFAYCSDKVKKRVYDETGWNENYTCIDRYDLVIHLVTAAKGAEKFYTLENNTARTETPELAKFFDKRIHEEWMIHPKLKVIDNSLNGFQAKLNRVVEVVGALVRNKHMSSKMLKLVLNCPPENFKIPEDIKTETFIETITYLNSNNPKMLNYLKKRHIKNSPFASYMYHSRLLNVKEEDYTETAHSIDVKSYFDFLKNKDSSRQEIKKEIKTFTIPDSKTVNIYFLELYDLVSQEGREKITNLNNSIFKENKAEHRLVVMRAFSDTEKFPDNIFKEFLPEYVNVTNNEKFFIHKIAELK